MAVIFESWLTELSVFVVVFLSAIYIFFNVSYKYWKNRGVVYAEPSFPFGNISGMFIKHFSGVYNTIYKKYKGEKVVGLYQLYKPTLMILDPETVKNVLVKDFNSFHDRGFYHDVKTDPLSSHLFLNSGLKWKNMRVKLTPTFTSGKMKMMFQTLLDCGDDLINLLKAPAANGETLEVNDILARYSTDIIASCAFGIQCNCIKNPDAEFRKQGRDFFKRGIIAGFGQMLSFMAPKVAAVFKAGRTPKAVADFFLNAVKETVEHREKNNIVRNDFMQLLIQLKNQGYVDGDSPGEKVSPIEGIEKMDVVELAAQAIVFFVAGYETSSTTLTFALYELSLNPEVQSRLRQEIDTVLAEHDGQITYEGMQQMDYLDRVIAETLRKYPPLHILNRECNQTYKIPDTDVVLEPGTPILISVFALHYDPEYFPEPERFDPERFTKEEKEKRHNYCYLPFGEGPRNCIGSRFGLMQTKVGLISLLRKFEFSVSQKTKIPVTFDKAIFLMSPEGGMHLKISERKH